MAERNRPPLDEAVALLGEHVCRLRDKNPTLEPLTATDDKGRPVVVGDPVRELVAITEALRKVEDTRATNVFRALAARSKLNGIDPATLDDLLRRVDGGEPLPEIGGADVETDGKETR